MSQRTDAFNTALKRFEETGDHAELVGQFSDDAELLRPELEGEHRGDTDAAAFWAAYRKPFAELSTTFTRVAEAEQIAVLEWTTQGTLQGGREIDYQGVSLLTYGDGDRVERFATYFDTAAFVVPKTVD